VHEHKPCPCDTQRNHVVRMFNEVQLELEELWHVSGHCQWDQDLAACCQPVNGLDAPTDGENSWRVLCRSSHKHSWSHISHRSRWLTDPVCTRNGNARALWEGPPARHGPMPTSKITSCVDILVLSSVSLMQVCAPYPHVNHVVFNAHFCLEVTHRVSCLLVRPNFHVEWRHSQHYPLG